MITCGDLVIITIYFGCYGFGLALCFLVRLKWLPTQWPCYFKIFITCMSLLQDVAVKSSFVSYLWFSNYSVLSNLPLLWMVQHSYHCRNRCQGICCKTTLINFEPWHVGLVKLFFTIHEPQTLVLTMWLMKSAKELD